MQVVTFSTPGGEPQPGILRADRSVAAIRPTLGDRGRATVAQVLGCWPAVRDRLDSGQALIDADPERARAAGLLVTAGSFELHAPLGERVLVVCAGANYRSHTLTTTEPGPASRAAWFVKNPNAVVGPGAEVELPAEFPDQVDYEGELCLVFGRPCHRARAQDAYRYIAGYTILNDISARDAWPELAAARSGEEGRRAWMNMLLGKQFPTFAPMGPAVVTADELADPTDLRLTTTVNGAVVQDANTRDLVVDIPSLVEQMSRYFRFAPGDVLSTGTPTGVGVTRRPPNFLKAGDKVAVTVEKVGTLTNTVVAPREDRLRPPEGADRG